MKPNSKSVTCNDLEEAVDHYTKRLGYRLDMIAPADEPNAATVSKNGAAIRLVQKTSRPNGDDQRTTDKPEWITGRAGMEYLDLIPGRLGGRIVASHIRLTAGGEVPDYVHYHKVKFQMIYCLAGAIRVVYEDQGGPFWLNPGDCVLQPPEIRHRVLECTAGSEVLEIGMPAVHETWVEHEIELPTRDVRPERNFGGQRFARHIAEIAEWQHCGDLEFRDTGIEAATDGFADVRVLRTDSTETSLPGSPDSSITFCFVLDGYVTLGGNSKVFAAGDGPTLNRDDEPRASAGTELVYVSIKA